MWFGQKPSNSEDRRSDDIDFRFNACFCAYTAALLLSYYNRVDFKEDTQKVCFLVSYWKCPLSFSEAHVSWRFINTFCSPAFPTCSSVPVFQTHEWPPVTAGWTQKALATQPLPCGEYKTGSLGKLSHRTTCFVLEKDLNAVFHMVCWEKVCVTSLDSAHQPVGCFLCQWNHVMWLRWRDQRANGLTQGVF